MGRYKVVRDEKGNQNVVGVSTGEAMPKGRGEEDYHDLANALAAEDGDTGPVSLPVPKPAEDRDNDGPDDDLEQIVEDANNIDSFDALVGGLHDNPVAWALEHVARLKTKDEVGQIAALERSHPKYPDGRAGIMDALSARMAALHTPVPSEPKDL